MSKADLGKVTNISPNTMSKLRRDEHVSLEILDRICETLNADFGDLIEYRADVKIVKKEFR